MNLVLATTNTGKIKEFENISNQFKNIDLQLQLLNDLPSDVQELYQPIENGHSFQENAKIKAQDLYNLIKQPVIAEDSGIEVECLQNRPGIYSARYAENDEARNNKLLSEIEQTGSQNRAARYVASICYIDKQGNDMYFHGTVQGLIHDKPVGDQGFGYDPIFYYPDFNCTFGSVSREKKATVSHRGKAYLQFLEYFSNWQN